MYPKASIQALIPKNSMGQNKSKYLTNLDYNSRGSKPNNWSHRQFSVEHSLTGSKKFQNETKS
jgi:hypothetical protein